MATDRYLCRVCSKLVAATKNNRYRSHGDCEMSSAPIPEDLLEQAPSDTANPGVPEEGKDFSKCPHCTRAVKLTRLGYYEPHDMTLRGGDRCPNSGVRFRPLKPTADLPLPGDEIPAKGVYNAGRPKVTAQMEVEATQVGVPRITGSSSPEASSRKPVAALPPSPTGTAPDAPAATSAPATETPTAAAAARASEGVSTEIDWSDVGTTPASAAEAAPTSPDPTAGSGTEWPALAASSGASTETSSPGSSTTSSLSLGQFHLGSPFSELILQPFSPFLQPPEYKEPSPVFLQPTEYNGPEKAEPMGELAKELATRIKETFYAYDNRKSSDNRSAQTTLGPSEIGTPCDRRLAMALMGIPPVNPGGDGWAAFVGTCGHVGMGEMMTFADAGTGRYAVEMPVFLGTPTVPRGTTDCLDRRDGTVLDWKFMGAYSLKKFKLEGPSQTYRIQAHVYGYGAARDGEKVRNVAIVGLPRAGGSLDDMHVWTEKYDKNVAIAALNRVEGIAAEVAKSNTEAGLDVQAGNMRRAGRFDTADDCRYCPFYLKNDKEMVRGCPGS